MNMNEINETHDPNLKSWVESANYPNTDFPIQNLPFFCFDTFAAFSVGTRIGDELLDLKLCYMPTCEYCLSHWVALVMIFITEFRLIFPDWRGYLLSFFVTAWTANQLMILYRSLRVEIKLDNAIAEKEIEESK